MKMLIVILFTLVSTYAGAETPRFLVKFKPQMNGVVPVDALNDNGFAVKKYFSQIGVYVTEAPVASAGDEAKLVRSLMEKAPVEYIERDERIWHTTRVPNDALYSQQTLLGQINLETAWESTVGSADTLVSVIDTGGSFDHPDLKDQYIAGRDFVKGTNDPIDENGHGTHVAGIIGAAGDNKIGVAGVNWKVRIMPLRFLDKDGKGKTSDGVSAILYAADHGARVMNCSWGGSSYSSALKDAIDYAYGKGTLMVAAAGNDSSDTDSKPQYPSAIDSPGVVSVAATKSGSKLASFSNYGRTTVHVGAPGSGIFSTYLAGDYRSLSGTSMAAPMVSGVAGLILAQAPNLSTLELRNAIYNAVTPREGLKGFIATEGEINAAQAVHQAASPDFQIWPNHMILKMGAKFQFSPAHGSGVGVRWAVSDPNFATIDANGVLSANALGVVTVTATDGSGRSATTGVIQIVEPGKGAPTPGCAYAGKHKAERNPFNTTAAVFNLSLPFLVGFLMRRRHKD